MAVRKLNCYFQRFFNIVFYGIM